MTRLRSINKELHGQRGVVLILFALLLPVLFGFMALAIDLARINLSRIELQNAADAAALAGALEYAVSAGDIEKAKTKAQAQADANVAAGATINCDPVSGAGYVYAVKVTINSGPMNFFFAPILGIASSNDVQASAIAAVKSTSTPVHSILVE